MKFLSQVYTAVSGSIGGITYSHNKGGMYTRGRATPTNPNSSRQQATRAALSTYAHRWSNNLAQGMRDLWNTYAQNHTIKGPFGEDIYINGISWYIMFNSRLMDAGLGGIIIPPPGAAPSEFSTFDVDISAVAVVDVTFGAVCGADEVMQLWMTLPGTSGQSPNFKQARLVGYSAQAQASPWAATMPFGVASGEQCTFFAARMNDQGQMSSKSTDYDLADY